MSGWLGGDCGLNAKTFVRGPPFPVWPVVGCLGGGGGGGKWACRHVRVHPLGGSYMQHAYAPTRRHRPVLAGTPLSLLPPSPHIIFCETPTEPSSMLGAAVPFPRDRSIPGSGSIGPVLWHELSSSRSRL